jgi:tripartite motif-containing protein 71
MRARLIVGLVCVACLPAMGLTSPAFSDITLPFLGSWEFPAESDWCPFGIATDVDGNVYSTDLHEHYVQKFTSHGTIVKEWGGFGTAPGKMLYPTCIAISRSGVIYVAENSGHRISEFSLDGVFLGVINGVNTPNGIGLDAAENIYVADEVGHAILKFSNTGSFLGAYNGGVTLQDPYGLDVDRDGNMYVGDTRTGKVTKISPANQLLATWGGLGTAPDQFQIITGICVSDDTGLVYCCDVEDHHVKVFTKQGAYVGTFGDAEVVYPGDVAIGPDGDVYVAECGQRRIDKYGLGATPARRRTWGDLKAHYR